MTSNSEIIDRREIDRRQENADRYRDQVPTNRRIGSDRRKWAHGLIFNTTESYRIMEEWLDQKCQGEWSLSLEAMDDALEKTSYRLMFEIEGDKRSFVEDFTSRR